MDTHGMMVCISLLYHPMSQMGHRGSSGLGGGFGCGASDLSREGLRRPSKWARNDAMICYVLCMYTCQRKNLFAEMLVHIQCGIWDVSTSSDESHPCQSRLMLGKNLLNPTNQSVKTIEFARAWLVGGWATPLKNMNVNWDDDIPNIWENSKNGNQTTNQMISAWSEIQSCLLSLLSLPSFPSLACLAKPFCDPRPNLSCTSGSQCCTDIAGAVNGDGRSLLCS